MHASNVISSRYWLWRVVHVFYLFKTGKAEELERSKQTLLTLFVERSSRDTDRDVDELATLKKEFRGLLSRHFMVLSLIFLSSCMDLYKRLGMEKDHGYEWMEIAVNC